MTESVTDAACIADADECAALAAASPPRTFVFAELHKSALNVRTNEEDAEATGALEASIARRGLLQPLAVHAAAPDRDGNAAPTPWGVLGGGRRLRAIGNLIAAGRLPADWPIPGTIFAGTDAEIVEMSLGENILRRQLREYEVHAAIASAVERGDSVEEIAANLGQTPAWVARQLRLGRLAPPILAAFREGEFGSDVAMAYAATEDQALQQLVFESLAQQPLYLHTPDRIRRALKVGDHEARRLLLFVGEAIYIGRGGMLEPDLFADGRDARVRVADETLLRTLAEERLAVERDRVRADWKRPGLRFAAAPPIFAGRTDEALEIGGEGPLPAARYPDDAIVATIDVDDEGRPLTRFWWASRSAKGAADKGKTSGTPAAPTDDDAPTVRAGEALAMPDSAYAQSGRAIAKDEYGLSADGLQLMRSLRRALLRTQLLAAAVTEGRTNVAQDYLVWAQARRLVDHHPTSQTGCRAIVDEWNDSGGDRVPMGLFEDFAAELPAEREWQAAVDLLKGADFMTEPDPAESLRLYLGTTDHWKAHTAAVVAGLALLRSADTPGWRIGAHDVLARACGADAARLRRWWTPTRRWLGLFGRMFRLQAAQPFVDAATHAGFTRMKDGDLTAAAAAALDPDNHLDPATRAAAALWLPRLLAFGDDPEPENAPAPEAAPAADPVAAQRARVKTALKGRANPARIREAIQ
ncbi:MAG TPA: ParB/RepB/Spo0J family partition protein [Sphingopyxis sp.]|nr:ParB/RepB/Spo0J family partition protein [Sphingopyxis sp.]HMP43939.1 ParB/RepB/Spo0J family partition protein [Sphingopyxis sp.]HMQ20024.1 ParB/RepB/Spo0J family partition protein [Sphingopyxis sp.]